MTENARNIESYMIDMGDDAQATHLMRFFKCAPGQYGFGDRFLGIRVPVTRSLVKQNRDFVGMEDVIDLIKSEWHEVRLAGFLFLIELYKSAVKTRNEMMVNDIISIYLDHIPYGNNWDLVDLVAPKILGDYLLAHSDKRLILDELSSRSDSLWHQRVAIVATYSLICKGIYDDTLRVAYKYLDHSHDLIHKATGWMLREMGQKGGDMELKSFLDLYSTCMPRTMLRYSIEHFPEKERQYYLKLKKK